MRLVTPLEISVEENEKHIVRLTIYFPKFSLLQGIGKHKERCEKEKFRSVHVRFEYLPEQRRLIHLW